MLSLTFVFCNKEEENPPSKEDLVKKASNSGSIVNDAAIKNTFDASTGSPLAWSKKWQKTGYKTVPPSSKSTEVLRGSISSDKTLTKSKVYILEAGVYVKKGATLKIEAGNYHKIFDCWNKFIFGCGDWS